MAIKVEEVMQKANTEYQKLCKIEGRIDFEIHSLQVKSIVTALVDAVNRALRELEDEIK